MVKRACIQRRILILFILRTIRNLKRHFENNFIVYLSLFFCLLLGIVIGSVVVKKMDYNLIRYIFQISNPYFNNINKNLYDIGNVFTGSILNNLFLILILLCFSFISFGTIFIPIVICLRGASLGLSVGILVERFGFKGFIVALLGIYPQNIFFLPGLIGIGAIAFSISYGINKTINKISFNNTKDIIGVILIFILIIFLGTSIEGFISPYILKLVKDSFTLV